MFLPTISKNSYSFRNIFNLQFLIFDFLLIFLLIIYYRPPLLPLHSTKVPPPVILIIVPTPFPFLFLQIFLVSPYSQPTIPLNRQS